MAAGSSAKRKLGGRIRAVRSALGMTQGELARAVGAEQREISLYEGGRTVPRLERLEAIAAALGVELRDLFDFSGEPVDREARQVVVIVERMQAKDPSFAKRALRVLRAMADDEK